MARKQAPNTKTTPVADSIPHEQPESVASAYARFNAEQQRFLNFFKKPTWIRATIAFITGMLVSSGLGYLGGTILGYTIAGALLLGANEVLILFGAVLGIIYIAIKAGRVGARIAGAILTGEADERATAAYGAVRDFASKFNPKRLFTKGTAPCSASA